MKSFEPEILLFRSPYDEQNEKTERFVSVIVNVVIALMVLLLAMYVAVEPVEIWGSSMEPNIHHGDTVVIDKLYSSPKRGDIVVIDAVNTRLIKRVVAVEGDRIGFVKEQYFDRYYISLYLDKGDGNGFVRINEPYIKEPMSINTLSSSGEGDRIFKAFTVADSLDDLVSSAWLWAITATSVKTRVITDSFPVPPLWAGSLPFLKKTASGTDSSLFFSVNPIP